MAFFILLLCVFLNGFLTAFAAGACTDSSTFCSSWKTAGYCNPKSQYFKYLLLNCKKSCGLCAPPPVAETTTTTTTTTTPPPYPGCVDKGTHCSVYQPYCNDPGYIDYLKGECKRTCNFCHLTTQPPSTTPFISTQPYTGAGGRTLQPGCGRKSPSHTRIVGGSNARPGDWPWQVNIDYKFNYANPGHHCGGTLITEDWILTAAHCFYDDQDIKNYWLKLGEHDIKTKNSWEQRFNITELHIHPKYNSQNFDYDLALIRLNRKVSTNDRVRTACIPGRNTTFDTGVECYISGWGLLKEYGRGPAILQQAKIPLIDHSVCHQAYHNYNGNIITSRMLCAGFKNGTIDTCQGDSGGPLVCKKRDQQTNEDVWFLWGTISWGVGCARNGLYGVYASPRVMRPWLDQIVFNQAV